MNKKAKTLIVCIAIPLAVGGISALISRSSAESFMALAKPESAPPAWLFPVVWTILFVLMGIASYLIYTSENDKRKIDNALTVYAAQLIVNFFWSILFFNLELILVSFLWIILLWILVLITIIIFYQISKPAAYLLLPYLLWITYAGYLNLAIYFLN